MTQQTESIESIVQDMRNARKLLYGVVRKSRSLETSFDCSKFLGSTGKILLSLTSLEHDLFDRKPTLSEDLYDYRLKPSSNFAQDTLSKSKIW